MSALVSPDEIEQIVGVPRHQTAHYGRAVSAERQVYILHSHECRDSTPDLRDCPFSRALDLGIDISEWVEDTPLVLAVGDGHLAPLRGRETEEAS